MRRLLDGQRVCIVGPASYIKEVDQGDKIDSFDVVARFIRSMPLAPELHYCMGSKTDLIISCMTGNRGLISISNPKILDPYYIEIAETYPMFVPYRGDFACRNGAAIKSTMQMQTLRDNPKTDIQFMSAEDYEDIRERLGWFPTTGFGAVMGLLRFPIKELFITGFTFDMTLSEELDEYARGITKPKPTKQVHAHNHPEELKVFKEVAALDDRIKCDPMMKKIIGII